MSQPLVSGVHICLVGEHLPVGSFRKKGWEHNGLFGAQCVCVCVCVCVCKLHYSFFYICLYKMNPLLAWHMKQGTSVQAFPCMCSVAVAACVLTVAARVHACRSLCVVPTTSL